MVYRLGQAMGMIHMIPILLRIDFNDVLMNTLYQSFFFIQSDIFVVCLYIDNLIILVHNLKINTLFKKVITSSFEMTNIKLKSYFLSIEIIQVDNGIFIFL